MGGIATINSLTTNSINTVPVSELMTVSTDQTITANTMISRIIAQQNVQATFVNNMKRFADNVVLTGQDNVIECERFVVILRAATRLSLAASQA